VGFSNKSCASQSKSEALTLKSTKNEATKRINHLLHDASFYNFMAEIDQDKNKNSTVDTKSIEDIQSLLLKCSSFLRVRMLNDTDCKQIKYFSPVNSEFTTGQILKGLGYNMSNPNLLKMNGVKLAHDVVQKTIVIEFNQEIVACGSIIIRKSKTRYSGKITYLMVKSTYRSKEQLIHTLIFSLESIANASDCSYTLFNKKDVGDYHEVVKDLDYKKGVK